MILNGIMWIARSRAPWWDFPERHGPWETVYSRFRKWIDNSILDNIFRVLDLEADLEELSIDCLLYTSGYKIAVGKSPLFLLLIHKHHPLPPFLHLPEGHANSHPPEQGGDMQDGLC